MIRICFVCLGNICRSPTAEGVFAKLVSDRGLEDRIEIDSAGTGGWHAGERADSRSRAAAKKRGYELSSRARKFVVADFSRFDLVIAMDGDNQSDLTMMAPDATAEQRIRMFRSFDPTAKRGAEVPDPYYGEKDGFETVLDICERASAGLLEHVLELLG